MFGKLLSKLKKEQASHPLATDDGIDAVLAEISVINPIHRLLDLAQWLDDVGRFRDEIGLVALCHAILRLDAFAQPACDELLAGYLDPDSAHHFSEAAWSQLDAYSRMLATAYRLVLVAALTPAKTMPDKLELATCAVRAMRALVLSKKLQRFRYRNPEAGWWQEAHRLLADASALGVLDATLAPYDNQQARRSPLQCYLVGFYLELAPLGNLVPQQVEALERFLELNIESLEWLVQRHADSTHGIDLGAAAGPIKLGPTDTVSGLGRYGSVRRIQKQALRIAAQLGKAAPSPAWAQQSSCDLDRLQSLLMSLILNWSDQPPQRVTSRQPRRGSLKIVHGFDLARRMVSYSSYARQGFLPDYDGVDLNALFNENRFGHIQKIGEPETDETAEMTMPPEPLAILEQLELQGDRQMMENWLLVDESASGVGAVAPGLLSRHRIGGLVGFRSGDDINWRMGVIRRIGRDAKMQPSIGIESLGNLALCAVAGQPTAGGAVLGNQVDAILPAAEGCEILLPTDTYRENLEMTVATNEVRYGIALQALLESGRDFDRVKFSLRS